MSDVQANLRRSDLTGVHIGRFVVLAHLGDGGMGAVYRARDTKLNRTVALKRLHVPDRGTAERSRILDEAERACRVNHANIAAVYDVIEEGDELFLVMEYVEGQTLRHRMSKPLSVNEAVQIALHCADALAAAHKQGIVHCDIKPENIMLASDGSVKLLDFGIARKIGAPGMTTMESLTRSTSFSGTPAYMAPEILNEQAADPRADLFSLGVVLYEMLAGENPFHTGTMIDTANRVLRTDPAPLPKLRDDVPEALDRVVAHALDKDRDYRYASATEMARDLRAVSTGQATLVAAPPYRRRRFRLDMLIPAFAAVIVLVAGFLIYKWIRPAAPASDARVVAVLPFTVTSEDRAAKAFSEGLVETLSAKLTRIGHELQVIPAWEVRSQNVTTAEQAEKTLGVNMVLEGSLRQADKNIRVTYSLVDTRNHRQLRGDTVTAVMSDPFAAEDRVVDSVLASLQIGLEPSERQALNAGRPTEPSAYDFYLQGQGYLADYHKPESVESAIAVLQRAVEIDPKFGLAYASLGEAYWHRYSDTRDVQYVGKAQQACAEAAKVAPGAGHACLGTVYNGTGRYEDAVQEFQQANGYEASNDRALTGLGQALEHLNRLPEAEQAFQKAITLHRSYWSPYTQLGAFYYRHARYPEAIEAFKRATELAPDNFRAWNSMAGVYLAMGDYKNAITAFEKSASIRPTGESYSNLASAYFFEHRYADAVSKLREALKLAPKHYDIWLNLAESCRWAGDAAQAKEAAQKAVELGNEDLRLNPRNASTVADMAYAYALLHDRGAAIANANKAVNMAPNDGSVLLFAALAQHEVGDNAAARELAARAQRAGIATSQIKDHPALRELAP